METSDSQSCPLLSPQPSGESTLAELADHLEALRLFGRQGLIEKVLTYLDFPAAHPRTLLLCGSPASAKSRFLSSFKGLLAGQPLPVAEMHCRPSRGLVPFSLLITLLTGFLNVYSVRKLEYLVGPTVEANPWLAWLFPPLRYRAFPVTPPDDLKLIEHGLESVLLALARDLPHLAIIQHLHYADPESLALLGKIQAVPQHGLRIITCLDDEASTAVAVSVFPPDTTVDLVLSPLDEALLKDYLLHIAPESTLPEITPVLFNETEGYPLRIETTLRTWALNGWLTFTEKQWAYSLPEKSAEEESQDNDNNDTPVERELAQLALIGTATTTRILELLWHTTPEDTQQILERGRRLGYLRALDPDHPDTVACTDADYRAYLIEQLTPEERQAAHHQISALLETTLQQRNTVAASLELAYHRQQSGEQDVVSAELEAAIRSFQGVWSALPAEEATTVDSLGKWDIAPPATVGEDDLEIIAAAVSAIRLTGVQFRLYPSHCAPVLERTEQAMAALEALFLRHPSLVITYDGHTVAYDGQVISRADLTVAGKEYQRWMHEANLRAIGFARGIQRGELERFLHVLATHEPQVGTVSLLARIATLNLKHINVLTGYLLADAAAPLHPPPPDGETQAELTHAHILTYLTGGVDFFDLAEGSEITFPVESAAGMPQESDDLYVITPENWPEVPILLNRLPAHARSVLIAHLTQWVRTAGQDGVPALPEDIDAVLLQRLQHEQDADALVRIIECSQQRLHALIAQRDVAAIVAYLEIANTRFATDPDLHLQQQCRDLLVRIGEGTPLQHWIEELHLQAVSLEPLSPILSATGEFALRPLLYRLRHSQGMLERLSLIQLLEKLCSGYQQVLLQELRDDHPWYYHRNLLQVLAEIGNEEALGTISAKLTHKDRRVRSEALGAAIAIAETNSTPYLIKGLVDEDETVRTRAAALAARCPDPALLIPLIRMLQHPLLGNVEPAPVQLAACASLGRFTQQEAKQALLRILQPSPWVSWQKDRQQLRLTALNALKSHAGDPAVRAAIQQATRDRNADIRHAALEIAECGMRNAE